MDTSTLELPRMLYKGPDDKGALPVAPLATPIDRVLREAQETDRLAREELARQENPTQTCRVETREELDAKLKDGWRLHRTLDKAAAAAADAAVQAAADQKQADADAATKKAAADAAAAKKAGKS